MAGEIRMDYDQTMRTAQQLRSVSQLVQHAQGKQSGVRSGLASWEGSAAAKAKLALATVSDVLKSYDSAYWTFARFFVSAAEQFTAADEGMASALQAKWDGAYDPGTSVA